MDLNLPNLITERILAWYTHHHRDLPWRKTRNPYFIWVSEVMLQQTRVDTVIPYYHRFLTQFPTVEALSRASLQEVLKAWENMGYYARARHLHDAAKVIMSQKGGEVPSTWHELILLPGIGSYTASAILSFAFGQRIPAVDGNVRRVLSRLFCVREPINQSGAQRRIHNLAAELVPMENADRLNQGIMELGAIVCHSRSRRPSCTICPVQDLCLAFQKGLQEALPITRKRRPIPHKQMTAAIICDEQGRLLIVQRPSNGLLGGMWKFPGGLSSPEETPEEALRRSVLEELGIRIRVKEAVTSVEHAYTHFRVTLLAFRCVWRGGKPRPLGCSSWQWVESSRMVSFPFSKADRKVIGAL